MSGTPDVRPVGDLPHEMGKTAPRELKNAGIDSLQKVSQHTEKQLLAIHGVGPKAIRILREALGEKGLRFREES
ncbi:hypothetical protein [Nesterenkonia sp.]|uniref:hypothetical protein n=1 Tax=Nesterenkonia sp. TaxID=704201 RepID=UPI0026213C11|nr:hypothetical protein [Nesterenkonia sp.]